MAWRYWWGDSTSFMPGGYSLTGAIGKYWPTRRPITAECLIRYHTLNERPLPVLNCTCGVYALKEVTTYPHEVIGRTALVRVLGIVEIWGKTIHAEQGYRSQYGQIRAFVSAPARASEVYGVPNLPSIEYAQKEFFS
jgi:hypothetical protein